MVETKDEPENVSVTWAVPRWRRFFRMVRRLGGRSVLRELEYERLELVNLEGRILDVGGGEVTNYSEDINKWVKEGAEYLCESVNIDSGTRPTFQVRPGAPFPIDSGTYDSVIALNTLEHVYELDSTIREIHRVLKAGGNFIIIVPFIFRVHGHPNDYLRGTASYWARMLTEHGFDSPRIEALIWGPFSTACTVSGLPGPWKRARMAWWMLVDLLYSGLHREGATQKQLHQDARIANVPLGYFIECSRRSDDI